MENTLANEIFNKLEALDPVAALNSINAWHKAIDDAHQMYAKIHTYCSGCNKLIKITEAKIEKDVALKATVEDIIKNVNEQ